MGEIMLGNKQEAADDSIISKTDGSSAVEHWYRKFRFYQTWQEAAEAARKLRIKNQRQYRKLYKNDPWLPSDPNKSYADFPGWVKFLDTEFYLTWQKASEAAIRLGIRNARQYLARYKKNPRLPSHPDGVFADFPGWEKFLGKDEYLSDSPACQK